MPSVTAGCCGCRRATSNSSGARFSSAHSVFLEPGEHSTPGVLGVVGTIGRAIVGVKAVRCVRIDLHFTGLPRGLAGRAPLFSRLRRNALILAAIEREHRAFDLASDI